MPVWPSGINSDQFNVDTTQQKRRHFSSSKQLLAGFEVATKSGLIH